jgi:hypothetical protein
MLEGVGEKSGYQRCVTTSYLTDEHTSTSKKVLWREWIRAQIALLFARVYLFKDIKNNLKIGVGHEYTIRAEITDFLQVTVPSSFFKFEYFFNYLKFIAKKTMANLELNFGCSGNKSLHIYIYIYL